MALAQAGFLVDLAPSRGERVFAVFQVAFRQGPAFAALVHNQDLTFFVEDDASGAVSTFHNSLNYISVANRHWGLLRSHGPFDILLNASS